MGLGDIELCNYDGGKAHAIDASGPFERTLCHSLLPSEMPWRHSGPRDLVECGKCRKALVNREPLAAESGR